MAALVAMTLDGSACAADARAPERAPSAPRVAVTVSVPTALVSVPLGRSAVLRSAGRCGRSASLRTADLRLPVSLQVLPRHARAGPGPAAARRRSPARRRGPAHAPPAITG